MPLNTSALQIGRSALLAYQQALQLAGNNIANAANPNYTRQVASLSPLNGSNVGGIQIGNGVFINSIERKTLAALESRLQGAFSQRDAALTSRTALDRIEVLFDSLNSNGLGSAVNDLFNSFQDLQNLPDDEATRSLVIQQGVRLTSTVKTMRQDLTNLHEDLNEDIEAFAGRASELAQQIADLNVQITAALAGGPGAASGLMDQRNAVVTELSSLVNTTVRQQPNGALNVFIGSDPIVMYGTARELTTTREAVGEGLTKAVLRFADDGTKVTLRSGQIFGAADSRDNAVKLQFDRLNTLARGLIREINIRHSGGQGLSAFSSISGLNKVEDSTLALNDPATGLALLPKSGSFYIDVKDTVGGTVQRIQINIDLDGLNGDDTTLDSLAAQISAATGGDVTATVAADGRLELQAATGFEFTFADDQSNVLAALGINTFFGGADASDIEVNSLLINSPNYLAAASNGLPGDGGNAGRLSSAIDAASAALGGSSIRSYYQSSVAASAVASNAAATALNASEVIVGALQAQRESISGVNLDEEALNLVKFQRTYQGAAQYLTVVDEMLQTLLGLVR